MSSILEKSDWKVAKDCRIVVIQLKTDLLADAIKDLKKMMLSMLST
ncbi:MAG: hypothetical protein WCC17_01260 [Candidatus Nitrosopolaris sp.]